RPGAGHNPELWTDAAAANSNVYYNNINPDGLTGNIINAAGTGYACGSVASYNNGANLLSNICQTATFKAVSGSKDQIDLHLNGAQASVDAGCGAGGALHVCPSTVNIPSEDIDTQVRYAGAGPDIGADELGSLPTGPTATLALTPAPPKYNGQTLVKQGT